jgi:hypothetical protein
VTYRRQFASNASTQSPTLEIFQSLLVVYRYPTSSAMRSHGTGERLGNAEMFAVDALK